MIELLYGIDREILLFINRTVANPVSDLLWPLITDYDKLLPVRIILIGTWLWMLFRDGARGRTAALLLIPLLFLTDQINSSILKEIFHRPRPCHLVDGTPVVQGLRLLVGCGGGMSFPSSHAVNNFGVATLLSAFYPRLRWWLFGAATLVALSRPGVGVHYPSDILAGALIGWGIALLLVRLWRLIAARHGSPAPAPAAAPLPAAAPSPREEK